VDKQRKPLEFEIGDQIVLRVLPTMVSCNLDNQANSLQGIVVFIPSHMGEVAYRLQLSEEFGTVHNVFHLSQLRKYISNPSHVIES